MIRTGIWKFSTWSQCARMFPFSLSTNLYLRSVCVCNTTTSLYLSLSVMQWCGKLFSYPVSTISFKTSNILLDLVTKIIVHFYTDFTSRLFKQIWLLPYLYGFCNPVQIHGMKINDVIWLQDRKVNRNEEINMDESGKRKKYKINVQDGI